LSNGGATASDQAGAQATFTFTGTSVNLDRRRWTEEGIARVFLDGSFVAEVDTYSPTKEVQVPLFTALDSPIPAIRLTIEVTGRKNVASNFAFVLVDAFDVPAVTISRLQDTDPAVVFSGAGWVQGDRAALNGAAGTAAGSLTPGDQATFTFTGTGCAGSASLGPRNGGIARGISGGAFMKEVQTYAPPPTRPTTTYSRRNTSSKRPCPNEHTLTVEVTGRQNAAAATAIVVVGCFFRRDHVGDAPARRPIRPSPTAPVGCQGNRDHPYTRDRRGVDDPG